MAVPIVTKLVVLVLIYSSVEACIDPDTFGGHMGKPVENISKCNNGTTVPVLQIQVKCSIKKYM